MEVGVEVGVEGEQGGDTWLLQCWQSSRIPGESRKNPGGSESAPH